MNSIHFANNLVILRKEKGITQKEVAQYVGVSIAAVSKWEMGQSFPDITILPLLATYFDVTIDDLLGYSPQLDNKQIADIYRQLGEEASEQPFEEVLTHCRELSRKYLSCYPLLLQIGMFVLNHGATAVSPELSAEALEYAASLFQRVQKESDNIALCRRAQSMEAYCSILCNDPGRTLVLLEDTQESFEIPNDILIASAWQMKGDGEKALSILQSGLYQNVVVQVSLLTNYLAMCRGDEARFEQAAGRALALSEVYKLKTLHPSILLNLLIGIVYGYMGQGKIEKAMDMLEQYAETLEGIRGPLKLHGDDFFDKIDEWLLELDLQGQTPRNSSATMRDLIDIVSSPELEPLHTDARFDAIKNRLDRLKE